MVDGVLTGLSPRFTKMYAKRLKTAAAIRP